MLQATSLKKLSQATATAALGVAMLAAVGTAPARAVNLQTVNFSANFAPQALPGSTGIAVDLQNGSLDGTYTLDRDLIPASPVLPFSLSLQSWTVNVRNSSNTILKTFTSSLLGQTGQLVQDTLQDSLLFTNFIATSTGLETASLGLEFAPGYINNLGANPSDGLLSSVVFKNGNTVAGQIPIKAVPEPMSIAAIGIFGAMGLLVKRKQKASLAA
ncbi:hypothetical protein NIES4074_45820 [Cylindrospermum sp. NIES-4074]|nr:hypothetical protein NIES4074_45820 [Cylindrospermum sp. NIES-4074]